MQQIDFSRVIINTPVGKIRICCTTKAVVELTFLINEDITCFQPPSVEPLLEQTCDALNNFFMQHREIATPTLMPHGTAFQQRVWQFLQTIPYGQTRTYGEVAKQLNTSPRAVGNACRRNPIPIFIPCHRIVGQNQIGGYAGDNNHSPLHNIKSLLLKHEGAIPQ